MILYNITFNIDTDIESEWILWLKEYYLVEIMKTGYFDRYKVYRLLGREEDQSINYAVQFFTTTLENLNAFLSDKAPEFTRILQEKFGHRHAAFMTVLQDTGL